MTKPFRDILAKHWSRYRKAQRRYAELKKMCQNPDYPAWYDYIAPAFADALKQEGQHQSYRLSGPFGIKARITVELISDNEVKAVAELIPMNIPKCVVGVTDYSSNSGKYPPGSVGHTHGLNFTDVEISDMTARDVLFVVTPQPRRAVRPPAKRKAADRKLRAKQAE